MTVIRQGRYLRGFTGFIGQGYIELPTDTTQQKGEMLRDRTIKN